MGQIRKSLQNLSLVHTFILCMTVFVILALILTEVESTMISNAQTEIVFQYAEHFDGYNGDGIREAGKFIPFSMQDSRMMKLYNILETLVSPVTFLICTIIAGIVFYRKKLKWPIQVLENAAEKIANDDLDFFVCCDRTDEMGRLCALFENMRNVLQENHREMWRQMEERKRLNAAFSHDLRTPLTVLKGHTDILLKYLPNGKISLEETLDTAVSISEQITRLENYTAAMNKLQRLEDIPVERQSVESDGFVDSLKDTAAILCAYKELTFVNECGSGELCIDPEILTQVFENLLSNAVRFADTKVSVICKRTKTVFLVCVADDGQGFTAKDLELATNPFYKANKNKVDTHFGLGLNICKILCERHNGGISLANRPEGGALVQADFDIKK